MKRMFRASFLTEDLKDVKEQVMKTSGRIGCRQRRQQVERTRDWSLPGVSTEQQGDQLVWRNRSKGESANDEVRGIREEDRVDMDVEDQEKPKRV